MYLSYVAPPGHRILMTEPSVALPDPTVGDVIEGKPALYTPRNRKGNRHRPRMEHGAGCTRNLIRRRANHRVTEAQRRDERRREEKKSRFVFDHFLKPLA